MSDQISNNVIIIYLFPSKNEAHVRHAAIRRLVRTIETTLLRFISYGLVQKDDNASDWIHESKCITELIRDSCDSRVA